MSIDMTPEATTSLSERVAEEIRALLARRRIKQSHLARQLAVSEQWISVRLRGVQPIDLNDLQRIAGALGVEAVELFPRSRPDDEVRRQPILQSFNVANRTGPVGHPKRTSPRPSTRRPGRAARVRAAATDQTADRSTQPASHQKRTSPTDNTRRTGRVIAVASENAGRTADADAAGLGAMVGI